MSIWVLSSHGSLVEGSSSGTIWKSSEDLGTVVDTIEVLEMVDGSSGVNVVHLGELTSLNLVTVENVVIGVSLVGSLRVVIVVVS